MFNATNKIISQELPEQLKLKEEWFHKTFENSPDCIIVLDPDGHILFINRCGQQLTEADSISQVKGALWTKFWKGECQQSALAALETARMGGVGRFEGFCPSQKGTSLWWDVVVSPVYDEKGRVKQFLSTGRDITLQKKRELKLIEANECLRIAANATQTEADTKTLSIDIPLNKTKQENADGESDESALSWFKTRSKTLFDEAGIAIRKLGKWKDEAGKSREEQRIHQSENRYHKIFNNAAVSIWEEDLSEVKQMIDQLKEEGIKDLEQYFDEHPAVLDQLVGAIKILDVNPASVRLFGAGSKEELLLEPSRVYLPEAKKTLVNKLVAMAGDAPHFESEVVLQTFHGKKLTLITSTHFPPDTDYRSVLVSLTDITERKSLEDVIKANASRLEQMLDSLPQMTWTCTPNGSAVYQSRKWCEYIGRSPEDTFGFEWADAVHPDDLETFYASWLEAAGEGASFFTEARVKRRDGLYHWHLIQGTPLKDSEGNIQSWVGANTDIHDKILQAEQLEQKVTERTADLQKANAALERSNKQLEEFAYVSSHDLQEPLRKIRTFIGRVQQSFAGALPAEGQMYLDKIGYSARRMSELINALLDYSRLSGQQVLQGPVNLAEIIADVSNDLDLLIEQKNATINVGTLPVVTATTLQMFQLFHNLIGNALKYSREDTSPVISISAAGLSPDDMLEYSGLDQQLRYQKIMVQDNGIGFEPGFAEQIFVIFQRLHGQGCQYEGTGIGLALCKKIVTDIGGRIWATSTKGQGAAFHIILPVME